MTGHDDIIDAEDDAVAPAVGVLASDGISRALLRLVLVLVVALLGTTLALLFYVSTLNRTPRTSFERDLAQWETAVKERPDSASAWARLAYTYAEADRTKDALDAVRRGERATGAGTLTLVEADVLRSAGRYTESLAVYDLAEKELKAAQNDTADRRKRMQIYVPLEQSSLAPVYFGRGLCRRELGDLKGAVRDVEKAVKAMPEQATMLVVLGDLYAETGDEAKARARYEQALTFVPDDASALEGLAALERGER